MRLVFLFVMLMVLACKSFASIGIRDTILLADVKITTFKTKALKPYISIDSTRKAQADMQLLHRFLQENTSVQFKTYGTSGSSVMSIRGANPSQSKIIWNGLSIGSPMLNMNDVSLISVGTANSIELHRGGASASEGSGALSGYVNLQSQQEFNIEKISFRSDVNQLQNQTYFVNFDKANKYISSSTAVQWLHHQNKFNYKNHAELGQPLQAQLNSLWKQFAIIQSFKIKLKSSQIEWHQWYQESDRQLSPPMYNRMRSNYQFDKSYRSIVHYKRQIKPTWNLESNISYTREKLRYVSRVVVNNMPLVLFNTNSYFDQVQQKNKLSYSSKTFSSEFTTQYYFDGAYVEDYTKYVNRHRFSIANSSMFQFPNKFQFNWSNRLEMLNNAQYFASSLNIQSTALVHTGLLPYISLSKNYNLPGLNDLYWQPGGNPNLKAERSLEQELGLTYFESIGNLHLKTVISAYNSLVEDWILWQPSAIENGLWTPNNLVEVKLSGIEWEQELKYDISEKHLVKLNMFYARTNAINNKAVNANDHTVGKQIIYVPQEKMGINLQYSYLKSALNINIHRVSHRYTTADHSAFLKAYTLVDLRVQQQFNFNNHTFSTALYVDNILKTSYESIPFQAMPARVFGININYLFNKKLNTNNEKKSIENLIGDNSTI